MLEFIIEDGQGKLVCPSCEYEKDTEHIRIEL